MKTSDAEQFIHDCKENQELLKNKNSCDKYDYLTAVACGAIGGIIDILFVGSASNSVLQKWSDRQVDNCVKKFAKLMGWNPSAAQRDNIRSAIGFLEKKYKVNYDQRHTVDVNGQFSMNTKNHHIMSLSHAPDVIGLFFSVLNQFTSTSSFISEGKLITIRTESSFELQGGDFITKIFCGIVNWFGHIMSDVAGSSGSRGNNRRGTGIVIPFFELFQICNFGKFRVEKDKQTFSTIAMRAFESGYDLRYGLTMSIPVVITELLIRFIWSLKQFFYYKRPLKECVPISKNDSLRMMLLLGNGTLCIIDGVDSLRFGAGNMLCCFMRFNIIAWARFISLVLREICIKIGLPNEIINEVELLKQANCILSDYLQDLKTLDFDNFRKETEKYN